MPCVDNKDLIYNVKELPETFSIASGDLLLVETDEGTNIMDYDNLIIGIENTTFGTTIINNSTDILELSASVTSLSSLSAAVEETAAALSGQVVGNTTKALITLSAQNQYGPTLVAGNNIASVEWEDNKLRFNFLINFPDTNYMVLPSAAIANNSNELVQFALAERQTNYVDLSAIDIEDGTLATTASANPIGFQIQTF